MPHTTKVVSFQNRKQALKFLKYVIKHQISREEISLADFKDALLEDDINTCKVFQHLMFDTHDAVRSRSDIDKSVARFRGLFVSTTPYDESEFSVELFLSSIEQPHTTDLYSLKDYTMHILSKIITDFYRYLTRTSRSKSCMLQSLKLLQKKYSAELQWMGELERRCIKIFGGKDHLSIEEFRRVIQYQKELSDRIFQKFDKSNSGTLSVRDMYEGLVGILTSDTKGRLHYLFDIYDADGNGTLNKEEVENVISMCISESNLNLHDELVQELSNIVWGNLTDWQSEQITFKEFYSILRRYPAVYDNLNVNVIGSGETSQMFRFLERRKKSPAANCCHTIKKNFVHLGARFSANISLWVLVIAYVLTSIGLVSARIYSMFPVPSLEYWHITAKAAGQLLNFNISFVYLLTLRYFSTKLRKNSIIKRFIPFDDMLFLHKTVAYITLFLGLVHTVAHGFSIVVKLTYLEGISPTFYMDGRLRIVFVTALIISVVSVVFLISTMPCVREYSFQLFIRLHQICAAVWFVCMLLHGADFWKWVLLPSVLFVGERLYFTVMMFLNQTTIETGIVHGNTTQLTIRRPKYFKFNPGDYVNINIPQLSRSEWHPFTISSSPAQQDSDTFTLHIRKVGSWTGLLHKTVKTEQGKEALADDATSIKRISDDKFSWGSDSSSLDSSCESTPSCTGDSGCGLDNNNAWDDCSMKTGSSYDSQESLHDEMCKAMDTIGLNSIVTPPKEKPIFTVSRCPSVDSENSFGQSAYHITAMSDTTRRVSLSKATSLQLPERSASTHRFSKSVSAQDLKVAPVHKMMRRNSLKALTEESALQNGMTKTLSSSRSSIVKIKMEEAPALDWRVYLDGPYSTPSREILNTKHAILVAGGIGITPFSSILESILNLLKDRTKNAVCCCSGSHKKMCRRQTTLQRIDFFWVTRDQSHLSLFHQVFKEIEAVQADLGLDPPLINLHVYLTGLKRSTDIRGAFLQLALEMIYQEDSLDVLSGLKAKTRAGRPNWSEALREVTKHDAVGGGRKSRPKLYVCGPIALCDELKKECYKQDIGYKEEVF